MTQNTTNLLDHDLDTIANLVDEGDDLTVTVDQNGETGEIQQTITVEQLDTSRYGRVEVEVASQMETYIDLGIGTHQPAFIQLGDGALDVLAVEVNAEA